jgi:hypothetical protein
MDTNTTDLIAQLFGLSRSQLLGRWQDLYGKAPPIGIRREVMIPFLAYRIQEIAEGGLSAAARAQIKSAARNLESTRNSPNRSTRPIIKTGTRVLRHWGREMHEVSVTESGYEYCGHGYRSLSEIARLITGTRWSGPAFFGLKKSPPKRAHNSA